MEIVVAVKAVPESETRLRVSSDGTRADVDGVKWVLAGYDESAVEQALLLKEAVPGSKVRAISFGPAPRSEEVLRASLALGCDAAIWVERPADVPSDPILAARALARSIRPLAPGLVLCGKQSGDGEQGLVASALGEFLGIASFGAVTDLKWDAARSVFTFGRPVEGGAETGEAPSPSVLGLQQAWNDPRTAKLPNILKSRKAVVEKVPWAETAAALGPSATARALPTEFRLPAPRTGAQMIPYESPADAAQKLVRILREEAKVFP